MKQTVSTLGSFFLLLIPAAFFAFVVYLLAYLL